MSEHAETLELMVTRMFGTYDREVTQKQVRDFASIVGRALPLEAVRLGIEQACRESLYKPPGPGHVRMCALAHVRSLAPPALPPPAWPTDREPIFAVADFLAVVGVASWGAWLKLTPEQREEGQRAFEAAVARGEVEVRWREIPRVSTPSSSPFTEAMRVAHERDALTKAEQKEALERGEGARFFRILYAREDAYAAVGVEASVARWAALNDLCDDAALGKYARGVRLGWAKAVRQNRGESLG